MDDELQSFNVSKSSPILFTVNFDFRHTYFIGGHRIIYMFYITVFDMHSASLHWIHLVMCMRVRVPVRWIALQWRHDRLHRTHRNQTIKKSVTNASIVESIDSTVIFMVSCLAAGACNFHTWLKTDSQRMIWVCAFVCSFSSTKTDALQITLYASVSDRHWCHRRKLCPGLLHTFQTITVCHLVRCFVHSSLDWK